MLCPPFIVPNSFSKTGANALLSFRDKFDFKDALTSGSAEFSTDMGFLRERRVGALEEAFPAPWRRSGNSLFGLLALLVLFGKSDHYLDLNLSELTHA